jgi:RNA polymerase sigma-70 factor, ECF subfamily
MSINRKLEKAFEKKLAPLQLFIRLTAIRYLKDCRYLEEVCQDVMLSAWRNFSTLPVEERVLKRWLYTSAKRRAIDYGRSQDKIDRFENKAVVVDECAIVDRYGDIAPHALAVCEDAELVDPFIVADVAKFFDGLSCSHRDVLLFSAVGYSYDEVARATSTKVGTVRSRLHYARRKARQFLEVHS